MAKNAEHSGHAISIRLSRADIAIVDRAARLRGRSRADFVGEAAVRAAEDVLMEHRLIHMSSEGFADFLAVVSETPVAVSEMVELARRPAPWESRSDQKR